MRTKNLVLFAAVLLVLTACGGGGGEAEGDTAVSFASPADGDTVSSPVTAEMQAEGFEVAPAAESSEGQGHFHVMVDTGCVAEGETIPNDDMHLHFGDGSTATEIELEPGEHTLCLQAGNQVHSAFGATDEITITVE